MNVFSELARDSQVRSAFIKYVVSFISDAGSTRPGRTPPLIQSELAREAYQNNLGSLGLFEHQYSSVFMFYIGIDFINENGLYLLSTNLV